jgi:methyltransferase, FkbM family
MNETVSYYAHPATQQDRWVIEKTNGRRGGYFVEIGAHNGIHHSNTLTLEAHYDWNGVLVEPDPMLFSQLHHNRPQSLSVRAVVDCEESAGKDFFFGNSYGGLVEHMPRQWIDEHERRQTRMGSIPTTTLHKLFEALSCPHVIDFCTLDVEGAELPILETFFKECQEADRTYIFKFLTVEFRYDALLLDKITDRLVSKGYELDCVRGFDACFRHKIHGV